MHIKNGNKMRYIKKITDKNRSLEKKGKIVKFLWFNAKEKL